MSENDLDKMSDAELAKWQAGWKPETDKYILADQEWRRRLMDRQHQLNLDILARQKEMTKLSVRATVIATIVGAILGAFLTTVF